MAFDKISCLNNSKVTVFGVNFVLSHSLVYQYLRDSYLYEFPSYVCFVDINVLAIASRDPSYASILNRSAINCCDGSFIALVASIGSPKSYHSLNGPTVFAALAPNQSLKQLVIGGDNSQHQALKEKLLSETGSDSHFSFLCLPFVDTDSFDYQYISEYVNILRPDLIWVTLGAPKQEIFISKLLPLIDKGILLGSGAAIKFYIGDILLPNMHLGPLHFIWLARIFAEPQKQISRIYFFITALPRLLLRHLSLS